MESRVSEGMVIEMTGGDDCQIGKMWCYRMSGGGDCKGKRGGWW